MIVVLILGYLLGMVGAIVFMKCADIWSEWNKEQNVLIVTFWPGSLVVLIVRTVYIYLVRLADVIVKKVCPNAQE